MAGYVRGVVLAAALLALGAGGAAGADSWLSSISVNWRSEMSGVLEMAVVNYSTPVINTTYTASVEFDMRAMGPVYNATPLAIDAIANKQAYPEGMVVVSDGHLELGMSPREDWRPLLTHYAGPVAFIVVAALLVCALPLAGVFWCCCYWCRAGRRRRPFDRKYDACLKGLLAILLIGLLTLFLFGVVCAFATDSQVESGLAGSAGAVRSGLGDARAFLNATQAHARWLLVTNYRELERRLHALLTSAGLTISVQLGEFSRAVSVTTLYAMVRQLDAVQADLRAVRAYTADLRADAEKLNAVLRSVKGQLLQTLARCDQPQCIRLQEKHKIGQLDTEIHYSQLPDVSELLNNVTELLESNIKAEVEEGQKVFRDIQREIQRSVDEHIPSVQESITATGHRLERMADEITYLAGNASAQLEQQGAAADTLQQLHAQYGPYRRYVGRAAAAALLTITCIMAWGLMCGVCGKRPDVYGAADCCNKGHGSKCLLCGIGLMFVVGGAVALVLLAYFVVGVAAQRLLCDPLTEPRGNRLFADVEKFVELEKALFNERADPDFNLTYVMLHCHRNFTIYQALQLRRRHDVRALRAEAARALAARVWAVRPPRPPPRPLAILRGPARDKLRRLAHSGLSDFDFDKILHALETNMTSLALDGLAAQLQQAAGALGARPGFEAVAAALAGAAARLQAAQAGVLAAMQARAAQLNATAARLRDGLRFNHSSLKDAITYLLHETTQAETFLNTQGPDLIQNMTQEFGHAVAGLMNEYMERVVTAAEQDVGRCGPLSHAFNATRDAHCRNILMPTNGYWMSLSWCVLLFIPVMVVAQRLARLYLHLDPYPGPLVEAEYLYDAYADRDNVPLANAYKAEKRAGRGAARAAAAAAGAGPPRAAPAPADAHHAHHARRYNDMAPKHWEEGPPRYHGPTEYERPPPYYYPGPTDRQ
ncbi:prominin-like protein isoform X1 [Pectinophora gossypiella]|uniref:prominin-like protein isoform X1 n=1 Tax=Pectinophora gossypiella TaxID=13191 RepID=UPI00214E3ED5|nr:prominin-like protein isoform X1 [Pectinophora gossypiella]